MKRRTRGRRGVLWFLITHPLALFGIEVAFLAPLVVLADRGDVVGFYLFAWPWLLIPLTILHLPLLGAAFRGFRLDEATKRNHALEHSTVLLLRREDPRARLSGTAAAHGFRVAGVRKRLHLDRAIDGLRRLLARGEPLPYLSSWCGSSLVTAQALGVGLLAAAVATALLFQPPLAVRTGLLAGAAAGFVLLRRPLGLWAQRRLFMSTAFRGAEVTAVNRVPCERDENGRAYFVRTVVWPDRVLDDAGSGELVSHPSPDRRGSAVRGQRC